MKNHLIIQQYCFKYFYRVLFIIIQIKNWRWTAFNRKSCIKNSKDSMTIFSIKWIQWKDKDFKKDWTKVQISLFLKLWKSFLKSKRKQKRSDQKSRKNLLRTHLDSHKVKKKKPKLLLMSKVSSQSRFWKIECFKHRKTLKFNLLSKQVLLLKLDQKWILHFLN